MNKWSRVVEKCSEDPEECRNAVRRFLEDMCRDKSKCLEPRGRASERYKWVEDLIKKGLPDGRARAILYIVSRYLVNVKGLDPDSALVVVEEFIDNSCKNHGNCGKIYKSWIRNVLRRVSEGGWKPWTLERVKEKDPELYTIITKTLEAGRRDLT
ncbi:MAG: DNA primase noncatalytic subunit PriX [Desulfurococcales archaeon]|nr:DNA primase noncatalytic subunit PriX [Desulfurococcales archaeon]